MFLYGGPAAAAQFPFVVRAGARGRPAVVTIHGVPDLSEVDGGFVAGNGSRLPPAAVRLAMRALIGSAARAGDAVIVHEEVFANRLADQYRVPRERIAVIPHPIPRVELHERSDARAACGFRVPTVLFFGFVTGYKGLPLLLEGWDLYRRGGGDGELVVAGGKHPRLAGTPSYEQEYAALRARAATIGGVRWDGYVAEHAVGTYLTAADALALPYRDGLAASGPLSFALAYGTPVLASDALAVAAPDPEGVAPREPQAWADLLHRVLHSALGRRLGEASRDAGRTRTLDAVAQRTVSLYRKVLS